jgi:hypothetical protein
VLSTPPAFVLSQDQTLQTKTTQPKKPGESESEKSDHKPEKNLAKKTTIAPPNGKMRTRQKTTNKNHQTHY